MKKLIVICFGLFFAFSLFAQNQNLWAGIRYTKERTVGLTLSNDTLIIVPSDYVVFLSLIVDDSSSDSCVVSSITEDLGDESSTDIVIPPGEALSIGLGFGVLDSTTVISRSGATVRIIGTKLLRNN